jgi:hypothetical protein
VVQRFQRCDQIAKKRTAALAAASPNCHPERNRRGFHHGRPEAVTSGHFKTIVLITHQHRVGYDEPSVHPPVDNSARAMLTDYNRALYDGDGNLVVPRHGIRAAMALAFADACAFWLLTYIGDRKWHELNPGPGEGSFAYPLWLYLLRLALPVVPLLVSELLLSARSEEAIAAGAGVAASLFLNSLIASLAAAAGFLFFMGGGQAFNLAVAISILTFIVCSLWVLVSSFRIGAKAGWGMFFLAAGATLVCMAVAYHFINSTDQEQQRQREQQKPQASLTYPNHSKTYITHLHCREIASF